MICEVLDRNVFAKHPSETLGNMDSSQSEGSVGFHWVLAAHFRIFFKSQEIYPKFSTPPSLSHRKGKRPITSRRDCAGGAKPVGGLLFCCSFLGKEARASSWASHSLWMDHPPFLPLVHCYCFLLFWWAGGTRRPWPEDNPMEPTLTRHLCVASRDQLGSSVLCSKY